ncbi:MAG: carboxylesterase family protein [Pseudomonadales bacterium]|jgi:para-nitrobenzyl esterase|nr:carboxylesterase family protein [Pseudomonadales bacterium]MDP6471174.1 carboxylesterase family protein [Pseudomonadales bacterium]MDP6825639.1 carboxylesterase family protein [Pseudomonadales bacterium]MDP6971609.1 carboxylesterase family protein [Pseudomonadales bacterium]|tara:strand:- start:344 stop:2203 length:1860 start_codon:yes stop_codon:yes gene_type:complete
MFKKFLILLLAAIVVTGAWVGWYISRFTSDIPPARSNASTERILDSGRVMGYLDRGTLAWSGIPFAAPPLGELRWKAPRPVEPWSGIRHALTFDSPCVQAGMTSGGEMSGDEDCLYLNVWAPTEVGESHPVMFFIHGGGNHIGQGSTSIYHGARYVREHDVVVVTINYRLGPFGWYAHPALTAGSAGNSANDLDAMTVADNSGNYGTLDVIAALRWVQRNVAQFGGDPANVTIFGESAGGFNVLSMMVSPLAAGLYHKAIVQSGGMTLLPMSEAQHYVDDAEPGHPLSARELVNRLLITEGQASDHASARAHQETMDDASLAQLLRSRTAAQIMAAQNQRLIMQQINESEDAGSQAFVLSGSMPNRTPYLFGDGHVLPAGVQLDWLFADTSRYNVTPVILGSNRNETRLFMAFAPGYTDRMFGVPYRLSDVERYRRDTQYGSDLWKADGVDELARSLRETQGPSVYAYRFDWDELRSLGSLDLAELLGAAHAFELPFVFGNFDVVDKTLLTADAPARDALSNAMMSYWAEFAYSGNPGRGRDGRQVQWQSWQNGLQDERVLLLDTPADGGIRMSSVLVTRKAIATSLSRDERFTEQERCALARRVFRTPSERTPALDKC